MFRRIGKSARAGDTPVGAKSRVRKVNPASSRRFQTAPDPGCRGSAAARWGGRGGHL